MPAHLHPMKPAVSLKAQARDHVRERSHGGRVYCFESSQLGSVIFVKYYQNIYFMAVVG